MQKLFIVVLLLAIVAADDSFLEKQKHVKQQKDLSSEVYTIKKAGMPTFLGKSSDDSLKEQLKGLLNYEEAMSMATPSITQQPITFSQSLFIIDESNPNAVRATEAPIYLVEFPEPSPPNYSDEKVKTFKENCIYVFSECNYKGTHAKSCPGHTNSFFGLPFEIKSIHIPENGSMTIVQSSGTTAYPGSQSCMRSNPIAFLYIEGEVQQQFGDGTTFVDV